MKLRIGILVAAATLMATALTFVGNGCSGGFKAAGDSSENSLGVSGIQQNLGLEAFQTGLYAYGQTQGCAACHTAQQAPYWTSSDINTAYTQAKALVDFTNPTSSSSIFIAYAGNSHCGVAACQDTSAATKVGALLTAWATAENTPVTTTTTGGGGGTTTTTAAAFLTATMPMPTTIPLLTGKTPALLRFDLSKLNTPVASLSKAILEVQIEASSLDSLGNITEYVISNPRIGGNTAAVMISGIHIYIRPSTGTGIGTEDTSQGLVWKNVQATAAIFALPNPLSTTTALTATPLTTVRLDAAPQSTTSTATDSMTIGFDSIQ